MRSLLAAVIISTYLFAPSAAVPLDDVYHNSPDYHQFQRRADTKACNKQALPFEYNIRRSPLSNNYDTQTGPSDCEAAGLVKHNGATGGWGLPLLTRARSAFQVYKGDNYKHMTTLDDEAVGLGTHICDHVLEIQVVKSILEEPNGVCELAAKRIKDSNNDATVIADVKAKLYNIVGILNGPRNLVFLSTEVEKLKGEAVIYASGGGANPIVNTGKGKKKRGPGYWKPGGVNDYLELKTKAWSTDVAGDIDAAIRRDFAEESSGTTVRARWSAILSTIKSETSKVQRDAQNEINKATCEAPTAGGSKFVNRDILLPLYATTTLGSGSGFDVFSSLTARAAAVAVRACAGRGGVKSGPKAPPGQSCPLKNQQQKKVVPRSQARTKPKPATKPRVPTQRPAPRQPNARKKVVPRPANRAKRQVGKPAQPKRTTPKRVPKTVPKPTRRPKGTPRQRRRRR